MENKKALVTLNIAITNKDGIDCTKCFGEIKRVPITNNVISNPIQIGDLVIDKDDIDAILYLDETPNIENCIGVDYTKEFTIEFNEIPECQFDIANYWRNIVSKVEPDDKYHSTTKDAIEGNGTDTFATIKYFSEFHEVLNIFTKRFGTEWCEIFDLKIGEPVITGYCRSNNSHYQIIPMGWDETLNFLIVLTPNFGYKATYYIEYDGKLFSEKYNSNKRYLDYNSFNVPEYRVSPTFEDLLNAIIEDKL